MLMDSFAILIGLVLLVFGAEALVRGSCWVALKGRISPAVIGLTIVAAGTSLPELMVSLEAAREGSNGLSIGNIVGSNTFNIAVILGLTALVKPLSVSKGAIYRDWPMMMITMIMLYFFSFNGVLGGREGVIMILMYLLFTLYAVWKSRENPIANVEEGAKIETASFGCDGKIAGVLNLGAIILGIGTLAFGAKILVDGSQSIAERLGISETIIGLTIIAGGTSMPELITSLVAAYRGRDDLAIANIIGSNIFNILGILGITGMVISQTVPNEIMTRDIVWLLLVSITLLPMMWSGRRLGRLEGLTLMTMYMLYTVQLINA